MKIALALPLLSPIALVSSQTLTIAGDNGSPAEAFPLQLCQGDCDDDDDCAYGLNCYQRSGTFPVPGCSGSGSSGKDYCYAPPPGVLVLMGDEDEPAAAFPLGNCQGDCDGDADCGPGLSCFPRSQYTEVPGGCGGRGQSSKDYCYDASISYLSLETVGDNNIPAGSLGRCQGDCDGDRDCAEGLICFQRSKYNGVPWCSGGGESSKDYCYDPDYSTNPSPTTPAPVPTTPAPVPTTPVPTESPTETPSAIPTTQVQPPPTPAPMTPAPVPTTPAPVPTTPAPVPTTQPALVNMGNNGSPAANFPLSECQGDCDSDEECGPGLRCFQRDGFTPVPGCAGAGTSNTDYCHVQQPGLLQKYGDNGNPASAFPLGRCEGDCDGDSECDEGLICKQRADIEPVPGCDGIGASTEDYCYALPPTPPTPNPTPAPIAPVTPGTVTYFPGDLTVSCEGLTLSTGLSCKRLTTGNQPVEFTDGSGGESVDLFHSKADGATIIPHPTDGGWYYTSNSESSSAGGVGAIRFNAFGEVIGYNRILSGTQRNCGGGLTYWGTWVTCEEDGRAEEGDRGGWVWEVDPFTESTQATGVVGTVSGNYESFAYDNNDPDVEARFYITEDETDGQLTRYTPCADSFSTGNDFDILSNTTCAGTTDYLVVTELGTTNGITTGTFVWTTDLNAGRTSADSKFRQCEGIDIKDRRLYMTCKANKQLYILNLDDNTYEVTSTISGAFNNQPDQVARILSANESHPILYFCEDGGSDCDIHGRDADGNYFTIVTGTDYTSGAETTGLTFSPSGKYMYFAIQGPSAIFAVWRDDGFPFQGDVVDIKYHNPALNG